MAMKLPGVEEIGQAATGRSGRAIASYDTSAIGQGVARLGAGMQSMAGSIRETETTTKATVDKATAFETERRYLEFQSAQQEALRDAGQKAQPGAFGFKEGYQAEYKKAAKDFFASVPDELKPAYDVKLFESMDSLVNGKNGAGDFERTQRTGYYKASVDQGLTKIENQLYADPKKFEQSVRDGDQFIDSIPDEDVSAIEKDALRRAWKTKAQLAALNGMQPRERITALGAGASSVSYSGTVQPKGKVAEIVASEAAAAGVDPAVALGIVQIESGFDPNAKADTSSAGGLYQFIDGTASQYGLGNKFDASANAKAGAALTRDNVDGLTRDLGRAPTPGEVYLAHFGGFGMAKRLGAADPNTPVSQIFSPEAIRANASILSGKTAGQVRAWADNKMAKAMGEAAGVSVTVVGNGVVDPRFADMDYASRETLTASTQRELQEQATADRVKATATYTAYDDAFGLNIELGRVASEQQIIADPTLNAGDITKHLKAFRAKQKDEGDVRDLVSAILAGDKAAAVNGFDVDERKTGDKAYDAMMKGATDEEAPIITQAFVKNTGYIPKDVQAGLRQGIASTDPVELGASLSRADALELAAPISFANFEGGKDARDKLTLFRHYVNDRGMSGEEAAQRVIALNDPAAKVNREVLKPGADKFLKTLTVDDVTNAFDTATSWEPGAGVIPLQTNGLLSEFREIAEEKFYEAGGDVGAARALALTELKTRWNVSSVSGSPNLMRMPPEMYYPPVAGGHDYLRTDAMKTAETFAAASAPGRKVENIAILPTDKTRADVEAGRAPRYRLFYIYDQDGQKQFEEVVGGNGLWGVDPAEAKKREVDDKAKAKQSFIDRRDQRESDISRNNAEGAAADRAIDETVGPDWMKARAGEAARERFRDDEAAKAKARPELPEPEPVNPLLDTSSGSAL